MSLPQGIASAVSADEAEHLSALAAGQHVLELGAQYGYSTIVLAQTAQRVHSVDWHLGDRQAGDDESLLLYWRNLNRHAIGNVVTHVGRFEEVLPLFRKGSFDGCFLDGDHERESVKRDTQLAWPLVRKGGWFAWHDYGREPWPVAEVVVSFLARWTLTPQQIGHLGWVRKP